jgi:hypothetical protein
VPLCCGMAALSVFMPVCLSCGRQTDLGGAASR